MSRSMRKDLLNYSGKALLIILSFYFAARVSLLLLPSSDYPAPVWPAAGVGLAALVLARDFRLIPAILLASFLAESHFVVSLFYALTTSLGETLALAIAAHQLLRLKNFSIRLNNIRSVVGLIVIAGVFGSFFSATIGALSLSFDGRLPLDKLFYNWLIWWAGDGIGILTVTPLIWAAFRIRPRPVRMLRFIEACLLTISLFASAFFVFYLSEAPNSIAFITFPVVVWAALRFEQPGAALSTFTITAVSILGTIAGYGPFAGSLQGLMQLQAFDFFLTGTALVLGAMITDRRHRKEQLAAANAQLTEKVEWLKHSRDQLDIILGSISDGISVIDEKGRIIYINKAGLEMGGLSSVSTVPKTVPEVLERYQIRDEQGNKLPMDALPYVRAIKGETTPERLICYRIPETGELRWTLTSSRPVFDETRQKRLAVTIFKDFTQRKRVDDSIKLLDDTHRMMRTSLDYEYTLSQLAHFAVISLADWCNIDLLEPGGLLKSIASAHRDPEQAKVLKEVYQDRLTPPIPHSLTARVILTGESALIENLNEKNFRVAYHNEECQSKIKQLGTRSGMVVPLLTRNQILGVMTFACGQSGRKYTASDLALAEEVGRRAAIAIDNAGLYRQAQKAIQMRDEFLSIASHELKTPITALKLQLQLRKRVLLKFGTDRFARPDLAKMLADDERQMDRLTGLVEEMLDITRFQSGALDLNRESVELRSLVQEIIERFQHQLTMAGCEVKLDAPERVYGYWDRARTEKMFTNVFSNAIKFGSKRPIYVTLTSEVGHVRLTVQDHGIGIAKDNLDRIFQHYEHVGGMKHTRGLGMGLYIARKIAEAHGGSITVESEPDSGSSFTIELPTSMISEASHA